MTYVAGVDGTPGGWAFLVVKNGRAEFRKVDALCDLITTPPTLDVIAIDIPIGLLDAYEVEGRACDRAARRLLGRPRGSSVFPAPVRAVLGANSMSDACLRSCQSARNGRGISIQTYGILPKIEEIDELLQERFELRKVIREVHPEVSLGELDRQIFLRAAFYFNGSTKFAPEQNVAIEVAMARRLFCRLQGAALPPNPI